MFVRKGKDGNLIAVGSIDNSLLTQLQRGAKKDSTKAESKSSSGVEPTPVEDEPKPEPVVEKPKGAVKPQPTASKLP